MLAMSTPTQEETKLFRLPLAHVAVLQHVAIGQDESDAGVRCHDFQDFVLSAVAPEIDLDGYVHALHALERWCDRSAVWSHHDAARPSWHRRVVRCRRTLARMRERGAGRCVDVLMVAHGYPDPLVRQIPELAQLREASIASLARYTDTVERYRIEMVSREAGGPEQVPSNVVVLRERVDGEQFFERRRRIDRIITSGDALRDALAPFTDPPPVQLPGEHPVVFQARVALRSERRVRERARRAAFLTEVCVEAAQMLSTAEQRYHGTWSEVGW